MRIYAANMHTVLFNNLFLCLEIISNTRFLYQFLLISLYRSLALQSLPLDVSIFTAN